MLSRIRFARFSLVAALMTTACGEGLEGAQQDVTPDALESRTDAVISGAVRGSTIQATSGINIRSGPTSSYAIVATANTGDTATILNPTANNGWYYISYRGTVGWTSGTYWNVVGGIWANGRQLTATQESRIRWIASNTVPRLQGSTRDERLTKASRVAWWALKEGVLDLSNPWVYSNCNTTSGDVRIGPLEVCAAGRAWQVGISGVQVPNYTLSSVETTASSLYPGWSLQQVLGDAAIKAGHAAGTSTYNSIVNSTGDLRKSWLLRDHATGFTRQEPTVTNECITNAYSWCYSSAWYPSSHYAPSRTAALRVIGELKATFDGIAP